MLWVEVKYVEVKKLLTLFSHIRHCPAGAFAPPGPSKISSAKGQRCLNHLCHRVPGQRSIPQTGH